MPHLGPTAPPPPHRSQEGQAPLLECFHTHQSTTSLGLLRQLAARPKLTDLRLPLSSHWTRLGQPPALPGVTRLTTHTSKCLPWLLARGALPGLRSLGLHGDSQVLPAGLAEPGGEGQQPEEQYSVDELLTELAAQRAQIECLVIRACKTLSNVGLAALLGLPLRRLELLGCTERAEGPRLGFSGIKALLEHPSLEELEVLHCDSIKVLEHEELGDQRLRMMTGRPGLLFRKA